MPKPQQYTQRKLEKMGVEVRLNSLAVAMDDESVTIKGPDGLQTLRCRTRIWAAGVQASPLATMLAKQAGVETDRAGRIPVEPDCTVPGHSEVFAIGDMVSLNKLPGVAQPALQEGKYVGKVIKARLGDRAPMPAFTYFDKGSMATIGYNSAVAPASGAAVTGWLAYLIWAFIHVLYLIGWGNRFGTLYNWLRSLVFSKNRGHRIITYEVAHDQATLHQMTSEHPPPTTRRTAKRNRQSGDDRPEGGGGRPSRPISRSATRARPDRSRWRVNRRRHTTAADWRGRSTSGQPATMVARPPGPGVGPAASCRAPGRGGHRRGPCGFLLGTVPLSEPGN